MIKSRLRQRRKTKTVAVKVKTLASGQYSETTVSGMANLVATHEEREAQEIDGDGGALVVVTDVFWFEVAAGETLPAIEEKYVLVDSDSQRYEVMQVIDQGGMDDRLRVMTRRLR